MNNRFSENLKKIRKDNNLSQEQLADELGVSRQAISKWESSVAYPEMDKIIAICDKFNVNIDDLLHRDIKEVKGEEESKKNINNFINDFLKYISDSVNLFSKMNFKSKLKLIFEELIIIGILVGLSFILFAIFTSIFSNLFSFIHIEKLYYFISNIFESILALFLIVASIVIITHIFKVRYLDYYNKIKEESKIEEEQTEENIEPNVEPKEDKQDKKNKIAFKMNEQKIVIRDPKHSEYKFINGLFKFFILICKFFALCFAIPVCGALIGFFAAFGVSFLVYKTGAFFIGALFTTVSCSIVTIIILLLLLNFIFNRKNNKKSMIWSFILSVVMFGIGCGLLFMGSLNFEVSEYDSQIFKTEEFELNMNDKLFFSNYNFDIEYVEKDIKNIQVEYKINKFCELNHSISDDNSVFFITNCTNGTKMLKEEIRMINNKKLVLLTDEPKDIKVYASKKNIEKIQKNEEAYYKKVAEVEEENNQRYLREEELQNRISELEEQLEECNLD